MVRSIRLIKCGRERVDGQEEEEGLGLRKGGCCENERIILRCQVMQVILILSLKEQDEFYYTELT